MLKRVKTAHATNHTSEYSFLEPIDCDGQQEDV